MERIRIGLVGCGNISRAHLRGWQRIPEKAAVVAAVDNDQRRLDWVSEQVPGIGCYSSLGSLLASAEVDAVDICLPHDLHSSAILSAAGAGRHVLCEKPLCTSLDEARDIELAVGEAGITFMCAHNQLHWPSIEAARAVLDEGGLGKVLVIRTVDCFRRRLGANEQRLPGTWRADPKRAGGGELIDTGYHPLYRLLYLASSGPVAVSAMTGRYHLTEMEAEDTANLIVGFDDGSTGSVLTSWAIAPPAGSAPFQVLCERGELFGDPTSLTLRYGDFPPVRKEFSAVDAFAAEVEHFADCLLDGRSPRQGVAEGLAVLRVILAAYEAAEKGAVVRLSESPAAFAGARTLHQ